MSYKLHEHDEDLRKRLRNDKAYNLIKTSQEAAALICDGMTVGIGGFTPSGYPKEVTLALADRIKREKKLKVNLYTGASVGPEVDKALAEVGGIKKRLPYHTDGTVREKINGGEISYLDLHLSQVAQYLNYGVLGNMDVAIVEGLAVTEEGHVVPTTAIGNMATYIQAAKSVVVEINTSKPLNLEGMSDVVLLKNPPNRSHIPIYNPSDRIGTPYVKCGYDKISAIVLTDMKDSARPLGKIDCTAKKISEHIIEFLELEIREGRLTEKLLPLQSGVGSVANAVLFGLMNTNYRNLTCYTEVIQDSMLDLIRKGKIEFASAASISLSSGEMERFLREVDFFKDKIVLRPQEISNNPEVIRRLGVIAMNTAIEIDIYGNVNSTHIMGSKMMNGIGGSGDFSRNSSISIFSTPSIAKMGKISTIVPMVSHTDHTEHEVMVVVTEQGYADLRGLSPKERALKIIKNCAHPMYKQRLMNYFERACRSSAGHTPHIMSEALSWHEKYVNDGTMLDK